MSSPVTAACTTRRCATCAGGPRAPRKQTIPCARPALAGKLNHLMSIALSPPTPNPLSPASCVASTVRTIAWVGDADGFVRLIDQTLLPTQFEYKDCRTVEEVWEAIRSLRVRGA